MDDVQQDAPINESEAESPAVTDSASETNQAAEVNQEPAKVEFTEEQQDVFNKVIAKKTAKTHEIMSDRDKLQREVQELRSQLPEKSAPVVPEMPSADDYYGDPDGFSEKIKERDRAISEFAKFQAQEQLQEQQRIAQGQEVQRQEALKVQESAVSYHEKAKSFGLDTAQVQSDAQAVASALTDAALSSRIVKDTHGPLIVKHLASNLIELDEVSQMTPVDAAVYIETVVKPKLKGKKTTTTPSPVGLVQGRGSPPATDPWLNGVTFK